MDDLGDSQIKGRDRDSKTILVDFVILFSGAILAAFIKHTEVVTQLSPKFNPLSSTCSKPQNKVTLPPLTLTLESTPMISNIALDHQECYKLRLQ
jgi:hypothetical protein